ncbi:MAG TPA: phosphoribosylformylglycinamidine synthase subunit PurQ [Candidatus Hydrogenedentes bacterium]|nr:phosphoribosylformylglycinamidine synthase subunit PurQ [Candidatus Hydrogenedentota bacterium]
MTATVKAIVLTGFGINCNRETLRALRRAGADAREVHLTDLASDPAQLLEAHILAIPGGFSFGDHVASGKILANRLRSVLGEPMREFVRAGKLAIGICNGFQVMVKMGLLPLFEGEFRQEATLAWNDSCRFENRWVTLQVNPETPCVWLRGIDRIDLPVRHGEGKFIPASPDVLERLKRQGQAALRYVRPDGSPAAGTFPWNPNGSADDIAGICDPSGRIFGLMPHPEAHQDPTNHPLWTRWEYLPAEGPGLRLFRNAVEFAREQLC